MDKPNNVAAVVNNQYLQLRLSGEWFAVPASDPQQFMFSSKRRGSTLTVSYEPMNVPTARLKQVIEKFVEFRMKSEAQCVFPRRLKLQHINFAPHGDGQEVVYRGSDVEGKYFYSFLGIALPNKLVSVFCESSESTEADNQAAFAEAVNGLRY